MLFTHLSKTARSFSLMDGFLTSWLAPLRSINDSRFSWFCNFFLKSFQDWLNSAQQCQGNLIKDAGQKMFISWQTYKGLKISVN